MTLQEFKVLGTKKYPSLETFFTVEKRAGKSPKNVLLAAFRITPSKRTQIEMNLSKLCQKTKKESFWGKNVTTSKRFPKKRKRKKQNKFPCSFYSGIQTTAKVGRSICGGSLSTAKRW